jgi:hypothetical protein
VTVDIALNMAVDLDVTGTGHVALDGQVRTDD